MAIVKLFDDLTLDYHANALAHFLPSGSAWDAKWVEGTNFRRLLAGFAGEMMRLHEMMQTTAVETDIDQLELRLSDWESALGLPDDCLDIPVTMADRQRNIVAKFAMMNISTKQDFIDLASVFGYAINIKSGIETITFPLVFPIQMFNTVSDARFTMIVEINTLFSYTFPLSFPLIFTPNNANILRCIFDKLVPATTAVEFVYIG